MSLGTGTRVGPYEILHLLGAGGMGEVYQARDARLSRHVAIKVLHDAVAADASRLRRFEEEARASGQLNHPNILTVYDVGTHEGIPYIVSELLDGESLRHRLEEGALPPRKVVEYAVQTAAGLAAAHDKGIVHRDLKPDNLFITSGGRIKILDFGLAKLTRQDQDAPRQMDRGTETVPGTVLGTAGYMAPEQVRAEAADHRSDIFAFGAILYEMLSGRRAFHRASVIETMSAILREDPPELAESGQALPAGLDRIVRHCLEKDPDERFQSARDLAFHLQAVSDASAAPAVTDRGKPYGSVAFGWRLTVGLSLAAAMVVAAIWPRFWRPADVSDQSVSSLKHLSFAQLTDQSGPEYFPSLSPDGKSLAYASRATGNWDIYLQRVGGRNPTNLTKDSPADDTQPVFSPDGEHIAFRSERDGGGIYMMGATGESVIRLSDFGYTPSWSPKADRILVGTEKFPQPSTRPTKSQLWVIDVKSGARRMVTEGDALQPSWSPHGQRIAYWSRPTRVGRAEDIWTIPADGGAAVPVTQGAAIDVNPIWSPDGKHLYFSSTRGGSTNVWRVPIDEQSGTTGGEPEPVTAMGATTSPMHLSFSSDGRHLAYAAQQEIRNLRKVAFDPSGGKAVGEPVSITRGSMQLWFPDPSPDGEWLAGYSMGNQRHIYILRTDGSGLRDLTDDTYRHYWPRWSPDGKRIAFTSRRTGNYEVWLINRDGSGLQQLTHVATSIGGAHYSIWSPDTDRIVYSIHTPKNDCVIFRPGNAWGAEALEYLAPLNDPSIAFEGWSWSRDGKRLAGIKHLANGIHSGVGTYDLESKRYDWLTEFGDWPLWLDDNRHLLFVSQGNILLLDTRTRKHRQVLSVTDEDVDIGSPGLSRDNRTIYFTYVAADADIWLLTFDKEAARPR